MDKDGVINMIETVYLAFGSEEKITDEGYFDGKAISSDVVIFTFEDMLKMPVKSFFCIFGERIAHESLYGVMAN